MTIGAVVDRLKGEFPDISVSKLRYLEEQGLVTPRRTKGGYRLFSRDDYQRLIRVLALQRDEYLPLKVIRKEIERTPAGVAGPPRGGLRKADFVPNPAGEKEFTAEELQQLAGGRPRPARRARGVRAHQGPPGQRRAALHRARGRAWWPRAARLARAGLRPKNLRAMKSAVDREGGLIEQVMLPALRSHRAEQRQRGPRRPRGARPGHVAAPAAAAHPLHPTPHRLGARSADRESPPFSGGHRAGRNSGRSCRPHPGDPRLSQARHPLSRHHAAAAGRRRRCAPPSTAWPSGRSAATSTSCWAPSRAASSSARPWPTR